MTTTSVAMLLCGVGLIALGSAGPKTPANRVIAIGGVAVVFLAITLTLMELTL